MDKLEIGQIANTRWRRVPRRQAAFTLLEVIVLAVALAVLAAIMLPRLARARAPASRLFCVNNMKNIGLAFRVFESDHQGYFPMGLATNQDGTSNYIGSPNMYPHFVILSNELSTSKLLICPAYWKPNLPNIPWDLVRNSNIDYFVGVDARPSAPNCILAGDRFLITDAAYSNNLLHLQTNSLIRWQSTPHSSCGNLTFGDGRVEEIRSSDWPKRLQATGTNITRLAMPMIPPRK